MRVLSSCATLASALALGLTVCAAPASAQMVQTADEIAGPAGMDRRELTQEIADIFEKHQVSGAYVAVTMGPDTVLARSYGTDPATDAAFQPTTTIRLASASKLLTALTVASLAQKGALSLDETLGEIDPSVPEAWRAIPVWRILNHTSGLPMVVSREDFNTMPADELSRISIEQVLEMIGEEPLDFTPGEQWRYQQSGYAILSSALAKRAQMPWQDLVKAAVIDAANLSDTAFGNDAAVFEVRDGEVVPHRFDYPALFAPAGGFQTTGEDARQLLLALASGDILNEDGLRAFINDTRRLEQLSGDAEGEGYGPGVAVQRFGDIAFFGHSGGGGLADIRFAPERQLGIAVLTNRAGGTGAAIEVADLIAERLAGKAHRRE